MYVLDHAIAMQIVSRTMAILDYNVNVMNSQGTILGSGDKQRIGTVHEGALLAITHNRIVEIKQDVSDSLMGVKPGINVPLHHHGNIIGVIGITGDVSELNQYGLLLKMTAEMIVEQANLQETIQWENRQKEEFILQLIRADFTLTPQAVAWAGQLGIALEVPRVAAVIEISDGGGSLKELVHLLQHPERNNLVAMISLNQLVILKPAFLDGLSWDPELESRRIDQLLKRLPNALCEHTKIALGHYFPGLEGLSHSYQTAQDALAAGKKLNPKEQKYLFEEYSLQVLLSGMKQTWRGDVLSSPYQKLVIADKKGVLVKTLSAYIKHFGDLQSCANALHIHRNTLRYRLDKIQRLTQLNIHTLDGLFSLYLGQLITK